MVKMKMHSRDIGQENIARLRKVFPDCVTETREKGTGKLRLAIDFDLLRQELGADNAIVEGTLQERYKLDWPGKKESQMLTNAAVAKTLRPARNESVDFDTTKNLFIEGDNLDALKLLQEPYLNKIKMIYIDPPYNTGNDFVYDDDFAESAEEYLIKSNQVSNTGKKLVANTDKNGRFHSDWLSMMYPRLRVARNLLADDGAIFISIDENEKTNLRKICDEVFGEENHRNTIITRRRVKSLNAQFASNGLYSMNVGCEYVLVYAKSRDFFMKPLQMKKKNVSAKGRWNVFWSGADRPTMRYELLGFIPTSGQWRWSKEKAQVAVNNYKRYKEKYSKKMSLEEYSLKTGNKLKFVRRIENGTGKNGGVQYWMPPSDTSLRTSNWTDIEVSQIHKDYDLPFENPKSIELMSELIRLVDGNNFTVLDFFAGSATTADAVMRLNAEDGGNRRCISIQLPESTKEKTDAYRAGFKKISDISMERIRLAGKRILKPPPPPHFCPSSRMEARCWFQSAQG